MKRIFTLIMVVLLSFAAHSQFLVGMHLGASEKNAVFGMNTQYQFNNRFSIGVNMTTHMDNSNPAYFQSRFGYTLGNMDKGFSVQPYTGYSYMVQNIEKGAYGGHLTEGVQFRYQVNRIALVYSDINIPAPHSVIFSVGIAGKIFRNR